MGGQNSDKPVTTSTCQISAISMRIHDGSRLLETKLIDDDEVYLLGKFWLLVTQANYFIDDQAQFEAVFIRQRTIALGLPSPAVSRRK